MLAALSVFNFDVLPALGLTCHLARFDYIDKMLTVTLVPVVLVALVGMGYCFVKSDTVTYTLLLFTFMILVTTSTTLFEFFQCTEFNEASPSESYLTRDMSVSCNSERYHSASMFVFGMLCVYPLGIPLVYSVMLWSQRHILADSVLLAAEEEQGFPNVGGLLFLVEAYTPEYFWFEVAECARRLLLASVVGLLAGSESAGSAVSGFLLSLLFIYIFKLRPFKSNRHNMLAVVFAYCLNLFFLSAIMLKLDTSGDSIGDQDIFGYILVGVFAVGPACVACSILVFAFSKALPIEHHAHTYDLDLEISPVLPVLQKCVDKEPHGSNLSLRTTVGNDEGGHEVALNKLSFSLNDLFEIIDTDGSGDLDKEEVIAAHEKLNLTKREAAALFDNFDHDGDGVLTKAEWSEGLRSFVLPGLTLSAFSSHGSPISEALLGVGKLIGRMSIVGVSTAVVQPVLSTEERTGTVEDRNQYDAKTQEQFSLQDRRRVSAMAKSPSKISELSSMMDANESGNLRKDDVIAAHEKLQMTKEEVALFFDKLDRDGDGMLRDGEWADGFSMISLPGLSATTSSAPLQAGGLYSAVQRMSMLPRATGISDKTMKQKGNKQISEKRPGGMKRPPQRPISTMAKSPTKISELFSMMDTNESGDLRKDDVIAAHEKLQMTKEEAALFFDKLDRDGDGMLRDGEWADGFSMISLPGLSAMTSSAPLQAGGLYSAVQRMSMLPGAAGISGKKQVGSKRPGGKKRPPQQLLAHGTAF